MLAVYYILRDDLLQSLLPNTAVKSPSQSLDQFQADGRECHGNGALSPGKRAAELCKYLVMDTDDVIFFLISDQIYQPVSRAEQLERCVNAVTPFF